ncbi:MAG: exodeoxyribonuclease V subunit beta [Deltaproteobacteria bacterium]|nr:exodeoxyribonuclease V subunit beta [Deltaproteobacteria bacterium]
MDKMPPFDLLTTPLEGTNLIEAGAGTGKTYAITALFLRLLIEKNLTADAILVVTFTEAATEELKARIRDRIRDALAVFSGKAAGDRFLNQLKEKTGDVDAAVRALKAALLAFDQAAIHTIHGFCWKLLREHAFESGNPFETDLMTDQEALKKEIVADFWRIHFYEASPLFIHYALQRGFQLSELMTLVNTGLAHVDLRITPRMEIPDTSKEEAAYKAAFKAACALWPTARSEVETLLTTSDGLHKGKYPPGKIPDWIRDMDGYIAAGWARGQWVERLVKFTESELASAAKKGYRPPAHPYFEACEHVKKCRDDLLKAYETRLVALKGRLFDYVREELNKRKAAKNTLSFDDLLLRVDRALGTPKGRGLKQAVRSAFRAALIDEFQDTDPVQYRIFNTLFANGQHILFLVGDAKQAIYGFRGADIFAYMDAARAVRSRYTLSENWRSEPGLIDATNAVFLSKNAPFLYDDIRFVPATPAEKARDAFTLDGGSPHPFQLWLCDPSLAGEGKKAIPKGEAREVIAASVAGEIARMVADGREGSALIGETPVRERDIAVLVRRNKDAEIIQAALAALNINSVLYTSANLFDSREALEMERLMAALADPNDEVRIRTALSTDMLGLSGEALDRLKDADDDWEAWLVKFRHYHDLWGAKGFIRMLRGLIRDEGILTRLIAHGDGERRATNLRHLSEVLHQAERGKRLRVHGLLKWLKEARAPDTPRMDTHQLRLESDEDPVKIVTIHKSKGLEYPISFCPFLWDGARLKDNKSPFMFHDEAHGRRATLDLGSEQVQAHRRLAEKEQLAENLRLLYVALTRAKNRCTMVWGRFHQSDTAAPAYLFHAPEGAGEADPVGAVSLAVREKDDAAFKADVEDLARRAGNGITVGPLPAPENRVLKDVHKGAENLRAREFDGRIDHEWRVSSFSSLSSGGEASPWTADRDMLNEAPEEAPTGAPEDSEAADPLSIFAFPKGARAGLCLHEMFEHLDFTHPQMGQTAPLVERKLDEYGFDPAWSPSLCEMIHRVLTVPLTPEDPGFTLSRINADDRLNELEFTFPLKRITPGTLNRIFRDHGKGEVPNPPAQWTDRLAFSPVKGFMRGFMDLVFQFEGHFYLVDWKSNFLGVGSSAYEQGALSGAMTAHAYVLQYHLYALALDRYLALRLAAYDYETHFGDIYYIFLRGVDPERDASLGIYRDRPDVRLIEALRANLIDET